MNIEEEGGMALRLQHSLARHMAGPRLLLLFLLTAARPKLRQGPVRTRAGDLLQRDCALALQHLNGTRNDLTAAQLNRAPGPLGPPEHHWPDRNQQELMTCYALKGWSQTGSQDRRGRSIECLQHMCHIKLQTCRLSCLHPLTAEPGRSRV